MAIINPPKVSATQQKIIDTLHPVARIKFARFIERVESETGWVVIISSAYRDYAKQAALDAKNEANADVGNSYHNYGLALDINLKKGKVQLMKVSAKSDWLNTGVVSIAKEMGLRWGGDYKNYYDPIHFDFGAKYPIETLKKLALAQFGNDPLKVKGNELKLAA